MRLPLIALVLSAVTACSQPSYASSDASREQLEVAIKECGVARADVRAGEANQTSWVWLWSYEDGVENRKMNCVREALADQNVKADFFDRSIADESRH